MVCFRFALLESGRRVTYEKLGDQNSALGFISSLLFDPDTFLLIDQDLSSVVLRIHCSTLFKAQTYTFLYGVL